MTQIRKAIYVDGDDSIILPMMSLLARAFSYTATIDDGTGKQIPNPDTEDDYILMGTKEFWRNRALLQAKTEAEQSAAEQAISQASGALDAITMSKG